MLFPLGVKEFSLGVKDLCSKGVKTLPFHSFPSPWGGWEGLPFHQPPPLGEAGRGCLFINSPPLGEAGRGWYCVGGWGAAFYCVAMGRRTVLQWQKRPPLCRFFYFPPFAFFVSAMVKSSCFFSMLAFATTILMGSPSWYLW